MPPSLQANYNLNRIEPASPNPEIYRRQVARMVRERVETSRSDSISLRRNVSKYHDLYRGFIRQRSQPFRNQVHLPLLFSSIEAGVAIKHGLLTGQEPFVEFLPSGPEDAPSSRRTTALVHQQFEDARVEEKLKTILRMGDITGTAIFQWSWRLIQNIRPQRVPLDPTGQNFTVINGPVTDFDGPWVEVVDVLDFFPQPGKFTIQEMEWCIRRYWMDLDDVYAFVDRGIFDASVLEEIQNAHAPDITSTDMERFGVFQGVMQKGLDTMGLDRYSKPVEVLEMHGVVPNEMVPPGGQRNRLITILNGIATARNVDNPVWSGNLPFGHYSPTRDPYSFFGIGKIEPNDRLQATANRIASQRLDAVDQIVDPMYAYNKLANVDTHKLYSRSGGLVGGDGAPGEWVQPLIPDLRGVQQGLVEIETLWRWTQLGTAITEEVIGLGGGGSDRQTAREFLGKMENVQRRMVSEALEAGRTILIPIGEAFRALDAQFLTFPRILRMLGQKALIDTTTGMPMPPDPQVSLEDVNLHYDMRASSAMSVIGRAAKQQNDILLLQAMGGNPMMAMITNWQAVARKIWRDFEEPNPEEYLLPTTPEQMQMLMMTQMMAKLTPGGNTGEGGKIPGASNSPNSDILDQAVNTEASANPGALGQQ